MGRVEARGKVARVDLDAVAGEASRMEKVALANCEAPELFQFCPFSPEAPPVVHEDDVVGEADPVAIVDAELEVHSHFELNPLGLGLDGPVVVVEAELGVDSDGESLPLVALVVLAEVDAILRSDAVDGGFEADLGQMR